MRKIRIDGYFLQCFRMWGLNARLAQAEYNTKPKESET